MNPRPATQHQPADSDPASEAKTDLASQFGLYLFMLVFIGFGLILLSDLLSGLFR